MKREALTHTKMKRLCRRLDIPQWQGVGLLESIWHLTARETPRGDIGKLSDEDIALAIDFRGDETAIIEALVAAGWLDRDPDERLIVHDWPEHCEDSVHTRLARAKQYFVRGIAPKLSKLAEKERMACAQFYGLSAQHSPDGAQSAPNGALPIPKPKPLPSPEPSPLPAPIARPPRASDLDGTVQPSDRFEEIWQRWPRQVGKDSACRDWLSVVNVHNEDAVLACAERYLNSQEVSEGKVRNLGSTMQRIGWLIDCANDNWASKWPEAGVSGGRQAAIDAEWKGIANGSR